MGSKLNITLHIVSILVVFRDAKMKEITVHKLEEMEKKLGETDKSRGQSDRDIKTVRGGS